jgi:multisubunit Na+/H+ antiporter MnhB subunit
MKTKISKKALASFAGSTALALVAVFIPTSGAFADSVTDGGVSGGISAANPGNVPTLLFGTNSIFTTIVNVLLFVIGAISVIMLIIGGIRYTISAGDSGNVTAAKNTIMYAIIGLVIAFLAYAIVNWVLTAITK